MRTSIRNSVIYVSIPRRFYLFLTKILRWQQNHDLNPLMKATHYVDEFIAALKLSKIIDQSKVVYIFGSMTLLSFFIRLFNGKNILLIYDPLSNYAQTLYLRSRNSILELLRYGLYTVIHKLQLRSSDYIVYPSEIDSENAKRMFNVKKIFIIPNPMPVCYSGIKEYLSLRARREDFTRPYFVLLAGGRGRANEEAVRATIELFNNLPSDAFTLFITGPWLDLRKYVKNKSIKVLGFVSENKIKELLAVSDYGLSPIFSHAAGTFMKVLAYMAARLDIIVTPWSLQGIDYSLLKDNKVYLIKNVDEYHNIIEEIILKQTKYPKYKRNIIFCNHNEVRLPKELIKLLTKRLNQIG